MSSERKNVAAPVLPIGAEITPSAGAGPGTARLSIPVEVWPPGSQQALAGQASKVARDGMFILLPRPFALGTRLGLTLGGAMGERGAVRFLVEVVREQWTPPCGVGVSFVEISTAARDLIERLVADQRALTDYRVEALLGRGGMAEVYRVQAINGPFVGTAVALKRILPVLVTSPEVAALFRRECEIGMRLKHPNIVETYEVRADGDLCFVTMELVEGHDLRRVIHRCAQRGVQLPADFACFVAYTVAQALDYAHHAADANGVPYGIVHRDVSPSNVFISHAGDIKLGDFGVAHVADEQGLAEVSFAGKEAYMAPEQRRGLAPSPAVDVFGLAAVLYEALVTRPAFEATSVARLRRKIDSATVTPPSALRPDLPRELDEVILRGLAPYLPGESIPLLARFGSAGKAPRRFATCGEFAAALRPLFRDGVGNSLAIAALMRHLFDDDDSAVTPARSSP